MMMKDETWKKAAEPFALKAKLREFRGEFAVLVLETSGSEVLWPKEFISPDAKVGDEVSLSVGTKATNEQEKLEIARKILEELVN